MHIPPQPTLCCYSTLLLLLPSIWALPPSYVQGPYNLVLQQQSLGKVMHHVGPCAAAASCSVPASNHVTYQDLEQA